MGSGFLLGMCLVLTAFLQSAIDYIQLNYIRGLQDNSVMLAGISGGLQSNLLLKAEPAIGSDQLLRALSSSLLKTAKVVDCTACSTARLLLMVKKFAI